MASKDAIKLAGPDSQDRYRVLSTKGTLTVRPGEIYNETYVERVLLSGTMKHRTDVTIVAPKFEDAVEKMHNRFIGEPVK